MNEFEEVPIEDEASKKFCSQTNFKEGFVRLQPYNQIFPTGRYAKYHKKIIDLEVYEDDVWVCTHPKSGTTWATEIVWCLRNNLDFEKAKTIELNTRVPFFDFSLVDNIEDIDEKKLSFDKPVTTPRPRTIKSHLSYDMLPKQVREKKVKIISVLRNPRDLCLSNLNHCKLLDNYKGDLSEFADLMLKDVGPHYGPYFANCLGYWEQRDEPNMLVLFFEDMKKDLAGVVKKMAQFLDVTITEDGVNEICAHTDFNSMKDNPMVNKANITNELLERFQHGYQGKFMNQGKAGRWKNLMDEATIKRFEEWEAKWLKDTGLTFNYK